MLQYRASTPRCVRKSSSASMPPAAATGGKVQGSSKHAAVTTPNFYNTHTEDFKYSKLDDLGLLGLNDLGLLDNLLLAELV